jgi:IclR family transcriptional regulator, acetate operon repressor
MDIVTRIRYTRNFQEEAGMRDGEKRLRTSNNVRSVDRALEILCAFSAEKPSMSVIEIQKKVRLSRPTVYRLLDTLTSHGFVRAHGTPSRFSLDYAVGRIAQNWVAGIDPVVMGRPVIEQLHALTKETVALAILRGHQHFYVLELPSPHVLSMSRGIGRMDHLTRGASGKVILAFMDETEREAVMRTAPKSIDKRTLLKDIAFIRANNFWVARSEIFAGAVGIAAPFFDVTNSVVGSIIVFGPEARFNEQQVLNTTRRVMDGAVELSVALGHAASRETIVKNGPRARP